MDKNERIRESRKATRLKHKSQKCMTFKFKVDRSSLSSKQKESLKMFFVETKRFYNYILSHFNNDIFNVNSDRDVHAANNMIEFYNRYKQSTGTVDLRPRRPLKVTYKSYKQLVGQEAQLSAAE